MQLGPWWARTAVKSQGAAPAQTKYLEGALWRERTLEGTQPPVEV